MIFKNWKVFQKIGRRFTFALKPFVDRTFGHTGKFWVSQIATNFYHSGNNEHCSLSAEWTHGQKNDLIDFALEAGQTFLIWILIARLSSSISLDRLEKANLDLNKLFWSTLFTFMSDLQSPSGWAQSLSSNFVGAYCLIHTTPAKHCLLSSSCCLRFEIRKVLTCLLPTVVSHNLWQEKTSNKISNFELLKLTSIKRPKFDKRPDLQYQSNR